MDKAGLKMRKYIQGQLVEDNEGRIRPDLAAFNLREDPEASEVFCFEIEALENSFSK